MNSIVSYPNRGPWGSSRYRGNCSGHLLVDLVQHFRPKMVLDPMVGSGTTRDVCEEMGIKGWFGDLKDSFNILADPIPQGGDFGFMHPPYHCLHPETPVVLADGTVKPVYEVVVGDKVINQDGEVVDVIAIASKPNTRPMRRIRVRGQTIDDLLVTEDHLCLVVEAKKCKYPSQERVCAGDCPHLSNIRGACAQGDAPYHHYKPIWKQAGDIAAGDYLLYTTPRYSDRPSTVKVSDYLSGEWFSVADGFVWYQKNKNGHTVRGGTCQYRVRDEVPVDEDFAYLAGLFIAEGSSPSDADSGTVYFTFHVSEAELIDACRHLTEKLFGVKCSGVRRQSMSNNSVRVEFYSKPLAYFFSSVFGKGARNKRIPYFLMTAPRKVQLALLKGLFQGDGCASQCTYGTTSRTLMEQVRMLCYVNGLSMAIQYGNRTEKHATILGYTVKVRVSYYGRVPRGAFALIETGVEEQWYDKVLRFGTMLGFAVTKAETFAYEGPVYDLQVSSGESFLTPSGIVHNCIIGYSGNVWGKSHPDDLSRCPAYEDFLRKLNLAQFALYDALRRGGHMAMLVGDVRRKGKLYPIQRDMAWFGKSVAVVIKQQHNCWSQRRHYSGKFIALVHEFVVVTKKPNAWVFPLRVTEVKKTDLRNLPISTWRAAVQAGLEHLGGEAELGRLYGLLFTHAKVRQAHQAGHNWQAQIRRALQVYPDFESGGQRGRWRLVEV